MKYVKYFLNALFVWHNFSSALITFVMYLCLCKYPTSRNIEDEALKQV